MNKYTFEYDTWTIDNLECTIEAKTLTEAVKKFIKNHYKSLREVLMIKENGSSVEDLLNSCSFKFH